MFMYTVADPGFPVEGGAEPLGGLPTSNVGTFQQKHVKMKELDPVGGVRTPAAPPGFANGTQDVHPK